MAEQIEDEVEELTDAEKKLAEYEKLKAEGEDYVECPRCQGSGTEMAVPMKFVGSYYAEREGVEYPCPLCNSPSMITIDIDEAIEWLQEKVDNGEEL